ncbi:uncharacterized protein [Epargyreus clarus]|uniref:uncharacterized protein n=1 Tax=Epargyreus clarus TaxID=520877 RepID=UPI003C2B78E9
MVRETIVATLAFTLICKYVVVVYNRNIVRNLIRYINDDYEISVHFPEEEKEIIDRYIKKSKTVLKFWILSTVPTFFVFMLTSFGCTFYYYCRGTVKFVPLLEIMLPPAMEQHKNDLLGYMIINTLESVFAVYATFIYNGFEPLLPLFLLHCCGQLEILSLRMKNIFKQTENPEEICEKIKEINIKLQSIYEFVQDVQITFLPLSEFTMKTTTFLLPFTVFEVVQSLRRNEINIEFLSLLSGAKCQFFMPCYYSDFLMEMSAYMRQEIYSCGWENHSNIQIRKSVLFMLTRTIKPVVLNTFFYPLSLQTYAEMARQSYAIYSILNAVWV